MVDFRFEHIERHALRAKKLAQDPNPDPALSAASPMVGDCVDRYLAAHRRVLEADSTMRQKLRDSNSALSVLRKFYDRVRAAISIGAADEPLGQMASSFATPDDLLQGARLAKAILDKYGDEGWFKKLGDSFQPLLDRAEQEWQNRVDSQAALQKLQAERRQIAEELLQLMVSFRKLVKAVYGKASKEYHSIKDYNLKANAISDQEDGCANPVELNLKDNVPSQNAA